MTELDPDETEEERMHRAVLREYVEADGPVVHDEIVVRIMRKHGWSRDLVEEMVDNLKYNGYIGDADPGELN
jgi:hypothetical protein